MAHIREVMALGVVSPLARMLGNNQLNTVIAGGSSQADATPLVINFALIETSGAGQGVRLGSASGAAITALYNVGPAALNLYPAEDETLNDQEANLPVSVMAGQTTLAVPSVDAWLVGVPPGGPGGIADAPSDGSAYGRYNASWAPVLEIAGGTLTGPLVLAGPPTTALMAATKGYVDGATALLAPLASPGLTGTPSAPSPPANDNSTRLATTAFVKEQGYLTALTLAGDLAGSGASPLAATVVGLQGRAVAGTAPLDGQVLGWSAANTSWQPLPAPPAAAGGSAGQLQWNNAGVLAGVTISGDATLNTATGALSLAAVNANVGTFQGLTLDGKGRVTAAANMNYAPLASPTFTGTPAAPTAPAATNTTQIATTAYVQAQGYQSAAAIAAVYAPLASPALTGTPTAPTAAAATNTTQLATTAFVKAQNYLIANQTVTLSGDVAGSGTTAITTTLATVNANVGTFQGITFDGKGRATAAANQGYWVADSGWSFSAHNLLGTQNVSGNPAVIFNGLQYTTADGVNSGISIRGFGANPTLVTTRADGTQASPSAVVLNDILGLWQGRGWAGSAYSGPAVYISFLALETWSGTANGSAIQFTATPLMTTSPAVQMTIGTGVEIGAAPTGGLQGAGTVNAATGYFLNGVAVSDSDWSFSAHNLLGTQNVSGNPAVQLAGMQYTAADGTTGGFTARAFGGTPVILTVNAGNTQAAPAAMASGVFLGTWQGRGWSGSAYSGNAATVIFQVAETWSATANGTNIVFQTTPKTTTTLTAAMTILGSGGVNVGNPTGGDKGAGTLNATAVYAAGVALTSDARHKTDIAALSIDALALVEAIEAKSFKHLAPPLPELGADGVLPAMPPDEWWDRTWWGFIAGEVDAAIAATGAAWDGVITDESGVQALSYNDLIAVLWRAVQQLSAQLQDLTAGRGA